MKYRKIEIPILNVTLHVYTQCKSVPAARKLGRSIAMFGPAPEHDDYLAISSAEGAHFGIFLPVKVYAKSVAHEIYHVTHRMMHWLEIKIDPENDEAGALINGYLHSIIEPLL